MKLNSYMQFSLIYIKSNKNMIHYFYNQNNGNIFMYITLFIFILFFLIKKIRLFYSGFNNISYISDKIYLNANNYICILTVEKIRLLLNVTLKKVHVIQELPPLSENVLQQQKKCSLYTKSLNLLKSIIFWFK
ncbi:Flagellar protein FliO [Buchnera aphidicola (Cinara kochiana kochiana)]|uniref:Flagellar protein FliO, partial n=1 Tax=Buchnera aphidicola (Cinara kochiana kochiana) TaxID=2518976 RepID=A0A451D589_9GAMM|nr:hypothetical protein [Buchnera aphidicola]VFP80972.1 Flagellar protein FliO [Buchnera aphidicola (Cinara kochiana kochiana)]